MFDAERFLTDYGIDHRRHHKHVTRGWVGIACPFCTGNPGYHGGFNVEDGYYNCWRCGGHWLIKVVATLTRTDLAQARRIAARYLTGDTAQRHSGPRPQAEVCELPEGCGEMGRRHRDYLRRRGFDPEVMEVFWRAMGTGPVGAYKNRIIAPVYFNNQLVSYLGRDITDRQPEKYKTCGPGDSVMTKNDGLLYGMDRAREKQCVFVEGFLDVWKLGPGAISTFGIEWSQLQLYEIPRRFDRAFTLFDAEDEAQKQAEQIARQVEILGVEVESLVLKNHNDPGELTSTEAREVMAGLGFRTSLDYFNM
jgi:DNA primase